jgi:alpha-amylase
MGNKVTLLLAIHNHQPVGNFDHVIEAAYQNSYLPFLETLKENPHVKLTLHYSGFLLEWLVEHHPEFIALIQELAAAKQVEIMSGGFYEPILTTLYDSDKQGQIQKLNAFIQETFHTEPKGIWLAERVWEPHLAEPLNNAGAEYIILDDHHFIMAGLREKSLYGYYLTEEKGKIIRVFPCSERLRYLIPFRPVDETIAFLDSIRNSQDSPLAIMGDDGEKFGVWPGTYKSVYEEGWLSRFFQALKDHQDWIQVKLFSETIGTHAPLGRIYLPTSSYMEMSEWSLMQDASEQFATLKQKLRDTGTEDLARPFISGGFWRNFFSKYPESNLMHKKMLHISTKLHHLPQSEARYRALGELWKGQCNDAYWHGVFGGLYLPHLRSSIYEHLIRAESIADHTRHHGEKVWIEASQFDLDKDGNDEVIINTESYAVTIDPEHGGSILELDFKPRCFNLQDTFTRIPEYYHKEITDAPTPSEGETEVTTIHDRLMAKETGLAEQIIYDPYPRRSLIDHFLGPAETLQSFRLAGHRERGDFVQAAYEADLRTYEGEVTLFLERTGKVRASADRLDNQPVRVRKSLHARQGSQTLKVDYRIENPGKETVDGRFGIEFNFTLLAGNAPDRYFTLNGKNRERSSLDSVAEAQDIASIRLWDEWRGLSAALSASDPGVLWRFPIESVSQSEGGFEKIYQGSCMVLLWDICILPLHHREISIELTLGTIADHATREIQSNTVHSITEQ